MRVHQFTAALATADGVGSGVLFTRRLLRKLGHQSDIYVADADPALRSEVKNYQTLDAAACDILLVHHSGGHQYGDWLEAYSGMKVMVYHNITPPEMFEDFAPEKTMTELGIDQLNNWSNAYDGAIAVSDYNLRDLTSNGYQNAITIPLLVDFTRLEGNPTPPADIQLTAGNFFLVLGRICENKRQHLLIEAIHHLKTLLGKQECPKLAIVGGATSPHYLQDLQKYAAYLELDDTVLFSRAKCSDENLLWYYQNSLALLSASAHEGFGMPFIEACYFGLPSIATATTAIPSTLGESGIQLSTADPLVFAAVLRRFLRDSQLQNTLRSAALANLQRFQTKQVAKALNDYLYRLSKSK